MATDTTLARNARATARSDRAIQKGIDAKEKARPHSKKIPQTGQRDYPVPPLPKRHQAEAGHRIQTRSPADVRGARV